MRIISGKFGGRKLNPPANMPYTRPTTDIAKEGLFNILQNNIEFEDAHTLDLFGGTGSISYELASRGAGSQVIVEKDPSMHAFISKTVADLGLQESIRVVRMDVFKYMDDCTDQYDFIFAGPPYALSNIDDLPRKVVERNLLMPGGMFVLEHTPRNQYKDFTWFVQERNYGTTVFSFFINR